MSQGVPYKENEEVLYRPTGGGIPYLVKVLKARLTPDGHEYDIEMPSGVVRSTVPEKLSPAPAALAAPGSPKSNDSSAPSSPLANRTAPDEQAVTTGGEEAVPLCSFRLTPQIIDGMIETNVQTENVKLREQNAQLREQNEQLLAQNQQLQMYLDQADNRAEYTQTQLCQADEQNMQYQQQIQAHQTQHQLQIQQERGAHQLQLQQLENAHQLQLQELKNAHELQLQQEQPQQEQPQQEQPQPEFLRKLKVLWALQRSGNCTTELSEQPQQEQPQQEQPQPEFLRKLKILWALQRSGNCTTELSEQRQKSEETLRSWQQDEAKRVKGRHTSEADRRKELEAAVDSAQNSLSSASKKLDEALASQVLSDIMAANANVEAKQKELTKAEKALDKFNAPTKRKRKADKEPSIDAEQV